MEVVAKLKGAKMSAQKARLVADQVRGKSVESALEILQFSTKKGADIIKKVLESAIANAEHNDGADVNLFRGGMIAFLQEERINVLALLCRTLAT